MNIYLDVDDVIGKFQEHFAEYFNTKVQKTWVTSELMNRRLRHLRTDKFFWVNMPIKHIPNFQPKGFVSARGIPKNWTKEFLKLNNIPGRNTLYHVNWGESKIEKLKELKCDIFIDDYFKTFKECNRNGIFCLLMDASHNQKYKTNLRIYDLDIDNIMSLYRKYKKYD